MEATCRLLETPRLWCHRARSFTVSGHSLTIPTRTKEKNVVEELFAWIKPSAAPLPDAPLPLGPPTARAGALLLPPAARPS